MALKDGVLKTLTHPGKVLAITVGIGGLVLGASGVFASLAAQATANQNVTSGALKISLAAGTGSAGFSTNVGNMRPGASVNRLVSVTNAGDLTASNLVLRITADNNVLTQAMTVAVVTCTATGYPCTTASTVLSATTANTLNGSTTYSIDTSFAPAETVHLRVTYALPALGSPVTTTDGALTGYQGVTGNVQFQFESTQQAASTTNS